MYPHLRESEVLHGSNRMPAGGGLLQLVATGKQDAFLTGNPQISFFKMVHRRHTSFAVESQPMYFDGTPNFGQRITCLIPRRGDLLGKVYLEVTLPNKSVVYTEALTVVSFVVPTSTVEGSLVFTYIPTVAGLHGLVLSIGTSLVHTNYSKILLSHLNL